MTTSEVRSIERRIAGSRRSLTLWRSEHERHKDAPSHRNYSRALIQHMSFLIMAVDDLGITHDENCQPVYSEELKQITEEWQKVDDFLRDQRV